jgi:hypothetical protein
MSEWHNPDTPVASLVTPRKTYRVRWRLIGLIVSSIAGKASPTRPTPWRRPVPPDREGNLTLRDGPVEQVRS